MTLAITGLTTTGMDGRCYCCSSSYAGAAGKHEQLCLALQVAQVRCRALVDSGVYRSLLRYDTWKDICEQTGKYPLLHRIPNGLRPSSKNKIPTLGIGRVCRFGQVVAFFVINNMQHMLSGDGALRTLKAKISYDRNENSLMGKRHVSKPSGDNDMDVHQCAWTWTSGLKNLMNFFMTKAGLQRLSHWKLMLKPEIISLLLQRHTVCHLERNRWSMIN